MAEDFTTHKLHVEKLVADGSNWVSYRDRMIWALRSRRLQDHITSTAVTAAYNAVGTVNNVTPQMRWDNDEATAMYTIAASIPNSVFINIKSKTTTMEVWNALRALYEGRTQMVLVKTTQQLQTTKCSEDDNVREHFDKLANLREQLAAMGKSIPDSEYASILMGSLPDSYTAILGSITATTEISGTAISPAIVVKIATDEYERRTLGTERSREEAFTADSQKKKKGPKRDVECEHCHKKGHTKPECWAKGGGDEGGGSRWKKKKKKEGEKSNAAASSEQTPDIEAWSAAENIEEEDGAIPRVPVIAAQGASEAQCELYDSGASRHMSPFREQFVTYQKIDARPITAANNRVFHAIGMGDLEIDVPNGATSSRVLLKDALHAPDLCLTVVSIGRIIKAGYAVQFAGDSCDIKKGEDGRIIGRIPVSANGLFKVEHAFAAADNAASAEPVDILTLHRRLGHISVDAIRTLIRAGSITGVQVIDDFPPFICDSCEYAKTTRKPIRKERAEPPAQSFGDEVHTDVWGPSPTHSLGGRRYYVTFTDDHTRFTRLEILRTKDEAFKSYKSFTAWAQTQHGARVKRLRSDRGGEFTSNAFNDYLQKQGTERRLTTADTPQHNGIAEALNRRLMERTRAILHQAGLPKNLWAEAILFAVWLKNRTSTKALGNVTPFEKLYGQKPNLANVPEWGQQVWVYNAAGSKLDARALQARWVGYDADSTHAHRVYWPGKNSVTVERNVKFVSPTIVINTLPPSYASTMAPAQAPPAPAVAPAPAPPLAAQGPPAPAPRATSAPPQVFFPAPTYPAPAAPPSTPVIHTHEIGEENEVEQTITPRRITVPTTPIAEPSEPRRSGRTSYVPGYYRQLTREDDAEHLDFVFAANHSELIADSISELNDDPISLREARSRPDWLLWKEAMDREMETLEQANTWRRVPRPDNVNIVGCKWVFHIKRNADGSINKYKARLVARGFTQVYGLDYFNTYSPVARLTSIRLILAIAARYDWDIESFDFVGAFLNGELDDNEEIYMQSPPGYDDDPHSVKRLQKSLYGLKQAGRKWYDTLVRSLTGLGFFITHADPGVFYARVGKNILILAVHVDDCILTGTSSRLITRYKRKLNACHALTDLGPVHWLLGIKVTRDRAAHTISLSQSAFIDTILSRFSMTDAKPYASPMVPGAYYSKGDAPSSPDEAARMQRTPYRQAIGSLMYLAIATRPDIAFAVSILSRFLNDPGDTHWEAVKRIYRYLKATKDMQLTYGSERHDLEGYTDADGGSQEDRHAIAGYAFLIDGGAISWGAKRQELVTLSTAEAEYVAATHAAKEALWLHKLFGDILPHLLHPATTLHCDNQSAIKLATTDNYHARTKHLDMRYHFIRDLNNKSVIKLCYCPTEDMLADMLTKALPKWKVAAQSAALGLRRACGGVLE